MLDQEIRHGEGRAFFKLGFVQNTGLAGGGVEGRQHRLGAVAALFGFAGNDAGNVGRRAGKEVSGHFDMHLAGYRGQMRAEGRGDGNRIIGDRRRGGVGVTRQCQQNVFERHGALLLPEPNLAAGRLGRLIHRKRVISSRLRLQP